VYVQAPPLGNQIPVLEGGVGGTCEEQVFVDIYIDSLYYSTLQFDAGYTKWSCVCVCVCARVFVCGW